MNTINQRKNKIMRKGIGPQGLGVPTNNGYTIGKSGRCGCNGKCKCNESPAKKLKDLSGDGQVTQKDVLIGRGVIDAPTKQKSPLMLKDACYNKVKASYKVFPSGYASAAIAKCRKNK
jgi:hypothetical protein